MKKFFINTGSFLGVLLGLSLFSLLLLDPYYGNPLYRQKLQDIRRLSDDINTLYYGSSRFYRHIDPMLADSLLSEHDLSSYNMGVTSLLNPQSYMLYEDLLLREELSLDYVFLEISNFRQIKPGNVRTPRNYYYMDPATLYYVTRYQAAAAGPLRVRVSTVADFYASWCFKIIYAVNDAVGEMIGSEESLSDRIFENRGYYPLNKEFRATADTSSEVIRRREAYLADTTVVKRFARFAEEAYGRENYKVYLNRVHLERLMKLYRLSEERGIELYFVISPRLWEYNKLLALRSHLPRNRVIELASSGSYPRFYHPEYTFDAEHLNAEGAVLFTREIARKIRDRLVIRD